MALVAVCGFRRNRRTGKSFSFVSHVNVTLRTPIPSDFDTLALWVTNEVECTRWAGPLLPFPFLPSELPTLLGGASVSSFSLVRSSDELVGFGQLVEKDTNVLRLARIIVAPGMRGHGLGRKLCERLLAKAALRSETEVLTLGVYRDNHVAISLYASLGFVEALPHLRPEVLSMARRLSRG